MDRRQFLSLCAGGALGNLTGVATASQERGRLPPRREPPPNHVEGAGSGMRRIVWSVETDRPFCALTFDDGPDPEFTPRILEILARHNVRATFLAMGYNAVRHGRLLQEVVEAGHEFGSHTWSHITLPSATPQEVRAEVERGIRAVESRAGGKVRFFRPPHGRVTEAAVRAAADLGQDIVAWSVTRGELRWRDPDLVASHVVGALGRGDIVDLHDGIGRATFNRGGEHAARLRRRRVTEIEALPRILEGVRAKGLHAVTLSELLVARRPDDPPPSLHRILRRGVGT